MIALLADILIIVLAVIGGLVAAAVGAAIVGWFVIRGVRMPTRTRDGDEADDIWI